MNKYSDAVRQYIDGAINHKQLSESFMPLFENTPVLKSVKIFLEATRDFEPDILCYIVFPLIQSLIVNDKEMLCEIIKILTRYSVKQKYRIALLDFLDKMLLTESNEKDYKSMLRNIVASNRQAPALRARALQYLSRDVNQDTIQVLRLLIRSKKLILIDAVASVITSWLRKKQAIPEDIISGFARFAISYPEKACKSSCLINALANIGSSIALSALGMISANVCTPSDRARFIKASGNKINERMLLEQIHYALKEPSLECESALYHLFADNPSKFEKLYSMGHHYEYLYISSLNPGTVNTSSKTVTALSSQVVSARSAFSTGLQTAEVISVEGSNQSASCTTNQYSGTYLGFRLHSSGIGKMLGFISSNSISWNEATCFFDASFEITSPVLTDISSRMQMLKDLFLTSYTEEGERNQSQNAAQDPISQTDDQSAVLQAETNCSNFTIESTMPPEICSFNVLKAVKGYLPSIWFHIGSKVYDTAYIAISVSNDDRSWYFVQTEDPYNLSALIGNWDFNELPVNISFNFLWWSGKTVDGSNFYGRDGNYAFQIAAIDLGGNVSEVHSTKLYIKWPKNISEYLPSIWQSKLAPNFTHFVPIYSSGTPQFMAYRCDTGDVTISHIATGLQDVNTVWRNKQSAGSNCFMPFVIDNIQYHLTYKSSNGDISIENVNTTCQAVNTWWRSRWTIGWTSFVPLNLSNTPHFLSYRISTGDLAINRIKPGFNGIETIRCFEKWHTGWSSFITFNLNSTQYYLAYKAQTGDVTIHSIHPNGGGIDIVWASIWDAGWTSLLSFMHEGKPHYIAYKSGTGDVTIGRFFSDNNEIDTVICTGKWSKGWSSFIPFSLDGEQLYIAYNENTGDINVFSIKL